MLGDDLKKEFDALLGGPGATPGATRRTALKAALGVGYAVIGDLHTAALVAKQRMAVRAPVFLARHQPPRHRRKRILDPPAHPALTDGPVSRMLGNGRDGHGVILGCLG